MKKISALGIRIMEMLSTQSPGIADILRAHIVDYRMKYDMSPEQFKVVYDILSCRTSFLGGHVEQCDYCGEERDAYNSCRNRHCPTCQVMTKERWLGKKRLEVLPVKYFHTVFTLDHKLNPLILCNKAVMFGILFRSVSETLLEFGWKPNNGLGGELGFICILHTWDQLLNAHFHLHCLIPGGALSKDRTKWIACKDKKYLFSVDALKVVFRGKFMHYFKDAYNTGKLIFPGQTAQFESLQGFKSLTKNLYEKKWVIHIKKPVKNPDYALDYLARYTHRVAISNNRILSLKYGKVTFSYKNRKTKTTESKTLEAVEFIRRFLLHVLPKRFVRIRSYGFMANRNKTSKIKLCQQLLGELQEFPDIIEESIRELMLRLTGKDIDQCSRCGKGKIKKIMEIPEKTGVDPFDEIWPAELRVN